ncbi:CRISPR-associated Cas3 family helicase [Sphaerotilus hippei]|uniref:CRISPR-associated Cas3 family helicase n=1 Tax=Sphaerotilus hippei TaxID=744406 RepID=A0A318H0V1_9BURK|nr:type I-F CRISPR-associated helicase Cas3f [Sphaerotilus hippei]PXW94115.1 CRISPR-associated Cas3 family helicase [Sphaerotilus hippei]
MNVLIISQCDKRALTETRRLLDQFAERRGDRTWQTPITRDGLDTLRRLLRQTARKNTAVACHWIRGLDHSELLWVVGDRSRFNPMGAVPTNSTERDILRAEDENDWHSGEDIHLLAAMASLMHDLGKACAAFQARLAGRLKERNRYRHEWVSLRLFQAFVGDSNDSTWLARLADPTEADLATWTDWRSGRLQRDGLDTTVTPPFRALAHAPLAQAIAWLIVTHHRLPVLPAYRTDGTQDWLGAKAGGFSAASLEAALLKVDAGWNEVLTPAARREVLPYWDFPQGLPVTTAHWQSQSRRLATRLQRLLAHPDRDAGYSWLQQPYVMHLSRLALMLADHHYSSLTRTGRDSGRIRVPDGYPLLANTRKDSGRTVANQTLDEHLIGVARDSRVITHALPRFAADLPALHRHKPLHQRSRDERFRWQDKAAELATRLRDQAAEHGAFIVNMASTGCGKTLGNARVMNALADPERGFRCAFAMGLRTLTLQTGHAFRDRLQLDADQLAIQVGGSASKALFEHHEALAEGSGSASAQALLDEDATVDFDGDSGRAETNPLLALALHDPRVKALLVAPLLVCTIDHLTPATESQRGGRQIAPMLRLLSGDLVLDEPDDFDIADLPALTRLIHWAGLLGSRVLLSSATLPPALVQGLFMAYRAGRNQFQRHRGQHPGGDAPPEVLALWLDEERQAHSTCATPEAFETAHLRFARERHARLASAPVRRRCQLVPLPLTGLSETQRPVEFARLVLQHAQALHQQHHQQDPERPGRRVSFGLVRMANIEPLVQVALALFKQGAPAGVQIHLCVYHSQFPLLIRSAIEHRLDTTLKRHQPDAVFALPEIRTKLEAHPEARDQLFIVLGSPVTEVGRDHDYDWSVVEPSSMRSLIQLAGRVRRHRHDVCTTPNLVVFDTNLRHGQQPDRAAFLRPGFELDEPPFKLQTHQLSALLRPEECDVIDARPRIVCAGPEHLAPTRRLADLEHARLAHTMLPIVAKPVVLTPRQMRAGGATALAMAIPTNAASWWHEPAADALLTAMLPQHSPFRYDPKPGVDLCLRPNEDTGEIELTQVLDAERGQALYQPVERAKHERIPDEQVQGCGISPWFAASYEQAILDLAEARDISAAQCAQRFATLSLPENAQGWRSHPVLGFTKKR